MNALESSPAIDARGTGRIVVAHLCTVDSSLRYLLLPQLKAILETEGGVFGISAPGEDVDYLEKKGIRHIALTASTRKMSLVSDLRASRQLWRILKSESFDVLHTHNPKPGLYGRVLGRLAGIPIVINTVHGLYATETDPVWKRVLVYALEAFASRFSDLELVQSKEDVATMRRLRLASEHKVVHLGNGVDLDRFTPTNSNAPQAALRKELGIAPEAVVVGCVARLVEEKGIPELIEAWRRRRTDYVLVVAGPGDPSKPDAVDARLIEEAEADGARFIGHRSDIEDLYHMFDLFVLPSHREGFPRAAMEAAATGLPLIASDVRGCREVVEHGKNGVLVGVRSHTELADAIDDLVRDEEKRREMGAASRIKALKELDEQAVVDKVLWAYRHVAERKGLLGEQ